MPVEPENAAEMLAGMKVEDAAKELILYTDKTLRRVLSILAAHSNRTPYDDV